MSIGGPAEQFESTLRGADAAARSAHVWLRQYSLRQRYEGMPLTAGEERQLAAGFLAGLRARFSLADAECLLAAYAFLLLRENAHGTPLAAVLLADAARDSVATSPQFSEGRQAALEMLQKLPV